VLTAAGTGFLLDRLLIAFHQSVASWYEQAMTQRPDSQLWERLDLVCRRFDSMSETLPGQTVDHLVQLTEPVTSRRADRRRRTVPEALEGLGSRVRVSLGGRFDRGIS
jgi:hypothetical protein